MAKSVVFNGELYGTVDYDVLENRPQISGVTLTGNKTLGDLGAIPASEKGANNGVATLDTSGKVPAAQLPAYVDDVVEYANLAAFPATGVASILYVALDTNALYRWSGSAYVAVSTGSGSLTLGETSSTAYRGDHGKTAYDHSQLTTGNPHGTVGADISLKLTDAAESTTLPVTTASDVGTLMQSIRNNLKALLGYFLVGKLRIANGGTGVATIAGQSATQRKVFASPKSTILNPPAFVALDPADIGLTATATELNYVDGVTSAIQTQLNDKISGGGVVKNIAVVASLPSTPATDTIYLVG